MQSLQYLRELLPGAEVELELAAPFVPLQILGTQTRPSLQVARVLSAKVKM